MADRSLSGLLKVLGGFGLLFGIGTLFIGNMSGFWYILVGIILIVLGFKVKI